VIFFAGRMEKRKGIHLCPRSSRRSCGSMTSPSPSRRRPLQASWRRSCCRDQGLRAQGLDPLPRQALPSRSARACARATSTSSRACGRMPLLLPRGDGRRPRHRRSDAGGLPELIEDGKNGLIARSGDAPPSSASSSG
jgi:hypothetical protein